MKRRILFSIVSVLVLAAFIIISCKKDESGTNKFSIGGTVEGLVGSGLVLQNNGSDDLPISENGSFTFPTRLYDSTEYDVTIESYPAGQTCYVEDGSGVVDGADVTDVSVVCSTPVNSGNCSNGSIIYSHDLSNDYEGFHQGITVSGTVPFTCDNSGNLSGSGTLSVIVEGTIIATCMETEYSGTATINVTLTGTFSTSEVIIDLDEIWYVGSPVVSGTITNTCESETQPYSYPLLETTAQISLTFPNVSGYTIVQPYLGDAGSGNYSWTLIIN